MNLRVQGAGGWQDIPITTPNASNACAAMSPGCPTTPGVAQSLNLNLPIPNTVAPFANANFESESLNE